MDVANYDVDIFVDTDHSDEDLQDLLEIVHRRPYTIRQCPNHMEFWDDRDFRHRFRLSKETVAQLLQRIDHIISFPTNRNSAVTPLQQLLLCLKFYACGNMLITVGDFAGVHKTTASQIIKRVTTAICTLKQTYITLPEGEEITFVQQGFFNIAAFPRVLLAVDGTHVKIQSPGGDWAEQLRNRKGYFSLNVMVACDHRLKIRNITARWPGSCNNINVFNNSALKAQFEQGMANCLILGDSGYPVSKYLMTPLLNPVTQAEMRYNESQIRSKNPVERCIGVWKRRFPVLALGLRLSLETVEDIIVATAILHNLGIQENEPELEVDPDIQLLIDEVIPVDNVDNINNAAYRQEHINQYFSRLG